MKDFLGEGRHLSLLCRKRHHGGKDISAVWSNVRKNMEGGTCPECAGDLRELVLAEANGLCKGKDVR